ncbi:LOW QUALITY PROTEIN: hypothetical protein CVT26_016021 [Gymnopilus dilepis]|uniref:Uncharacterized protein n=1 Tax=Gymnopilus dilepis TaxID=231916 RepID=A0A409YDU7_9AGAR|nr:LOW QUALITY PROTEIN: hypothetical protein CVT26_016021 [Gymnopilus dilepis]
MSDQQTQSRLIFVDDSSPNIRYTDGWTIEVFKPTQEPQTFTPLYDTLHVLETLNNVLHNISFFFADLRLRALDGADLADFVLIGTAAIAVFGPGTGIQAIKACTIDSVQNSTVFMNDIAGQVECNVDMLGASYHELKIEVAANEENPGTITFDGVYFSPLTVQDEFGDVVYEADGADIKMSISDTGQGTLDFDFNGETLPSIRDNTLHSNHHYKPQTGYLLAVYADFSLNDLTMPSTLSYAIDEDPPQNFTITNAADAITTTVLTKRILQTPAYLAGKHHLHMVFYGTNETVPFNLNQIIVQNTTSPNVPLQPFPVASSTSTETATTPPTQTPPQSTFRGPSAQSHLGMYIGITLGSAVTLILMTWIIFRWRKRRKTSLLHEESNVSSEALIEPFRLSSRPRNRVVGKGATYVEVRRTSGQIARSTPFESRGRDHEGPRTGTDVPPDYISSW